MNLKMWKKLIKKKKENEIVKNKGKDIFENSKKEGKDCGNINEKVKEEQKVERIEKVKEEQKVENIDESKKRTNS